MKTTDPNSKFYRSEELEVPILFPNGDVRYAWKIESRQNGKRKRAYFRTKKEANAERDSRNNQLVALGSQNVLTSLDQVMAAECVRRLSSRNQTLVDAVNFYLGYLDRQESSITVAELCKRAIAEYTDQLERGEIKSVKYVIALKDASRRFSSVFGDRIIATMNGNEIKDWVTGLTILDGTAPLALKTRNNYLKSIMTFFTLAQKKDWIGTDIFALVDTFRLPTQTNEILTVEEMSAFLNAVSPEYQPAFALIAFAGIRSDEVEKLDWSDIKLDSDLVIVSKENAKTSRERRPEILPNLKAWLTPYAKTDGPIVAGNGLDREQEKASKRAGIVWKKNGLRNSFASYAVAHKGYDWEARQAGHSFKTSEKNYQVWVDPKDAAKYWAMVP